MMDSLTAFQWLKHTIFHPVEGFEDLRWKKQGSVRIAIGIVALLFVAVVIQRQLMAVPFNNSYIKVFNVVPLFIQSVLYFMTWVIANWSLCTLLDGEGTMKKIFIYSAYSMVPYAVCTIIATFLSNFLVRDEAIWLSAVYYLGVGWSVILMISAVKAVHQYSMSKTILSMLGTLIVMVLILLLLVLLASLFQQVFGFFYEIYREISYIIRG